MDPEVLNPRRDRIEEAAPTRPNCEPSIRSLRIESGRGQAAVSAMVLGLLYGLWGPPVQAETESTKLTASDAGAGDQFGFSVATSGTTVVVGAKYDDDGRPNSGSAYVYECSSLPCNEVSKLSASDAGAGDQFGFSVAISETKVVVGALQGDGVVEYSGSAYVFDLASCGAACTESAKLAASDGAAYDQFGVSVAIDGTTAVIGALDDDDGGSNSGSAYAFDLASCGTACTESAKLTASDAAALDEFGRSVAVSGARAVVGARGDDDAGDASGSAYVYDCSSLPCKQVSKLVASDGAAYDWFGNSVAVSGTTAVVGALRDDDAGAATGSAYVFDCSRLPCKQTSKLTASDGAAGDWFGTSVAVSGTTAAVGAVESDSGAVQSSGSAYLFDLANCGAACTESAKLTASDAAAGDNFGISVALSGAAVVVGAEGDDDAGESSGSAYVFNFGNSAPLDLDLDGTTDALTDGLLLMRHLFGFTGTSLTNGALAPDATRTDPVAIIDHVEAYRAELDIDASGKTDALTDGLLVMRHLFGFSGTALTQGALAPNATRTSPAAIAAYIEGLR